MNITSYMKEHPVYSWLYFSTVLVVMSALFLPIKPWLSAPWLGSVSVAIGHIFPIIHVLANSSQMPEVVMTTIAQAVLYGAILGVAWSVIFVISIDGRKENVYSVIEKRTVKQRIVTILIFALLDYFIYRDVIASIILDFGGNVSSIAILHLGVNLGFLSGMGVRNPHITDSAFFFYVWYAPVSRLALAPTALLEYFNSSIVFGGWVLLIVLPVMSLISIMRGERSLKNRGRIG